MLKASKPALGTLTGAAARRIYYAHKIGMASEHKDYYAVLGVSRQASLAELKQAYRRLAKVYHPDVHPEQNKTAASEKFKELNEAYEVLSHSEKRALYDKRGQDWSSSSKTGNAPPGHRHSPPMSGEKTGERRQPPAAPVTENKIRKYFWRGVPIVAVLLFITLINWRPQGYGFNLEKETSTETLSLLGSWFHPRTIRFDAQGALEVSQGSWSGGDITIAIPREQIKSITLNHDMSWDSVSIKCGTSWSCAYTLYFEKDGTADQTKTFLLTGLGPKNEFIAWKAEELRKSRVANEWLEKELSKIAAPSKK